MPGSIRRVGLGWGEPQMQLEQTLSSQKCEAIDGSLVAKWHKENESDITV